MGNTVLKEKNSSYENGSTGGKVSTTVMAHGCVSKYQPVKLGKLTWKKVALVMDRFCLVFFGILDIVVIVAFFCYYPMGETYGPAKFQREEVHWKFNDIMQ